MMEFWHVPLPLQRRLWQALGSARWSRASGWRQQLGLFTTTKLIPAKTLMFTMCAPAEVVAVIEALYHERRLDRRSASLLEAYLLAQTDRHGRWVGATGPGPAPLDVNAEIYAAFDEWR
jgi:hypothetical protein